MNVRWIALGLAGIAAAAAAQDAPMTLRDIADKSPRKLTKDEVSALIPGATMSRVSQRGNRHYWTNDAGGTFMASSDNMGAGSGGTRSAGRPSTAPGKWHISDDGRYCILIEWRGVPTEEWCRFVFTTTDGYYVARSDSVGTERVEKFEIKK